MKSRIAIKGLLDTETGTFSTPEKRATHNRDTFIKYFTQDKSKYGLPNRKYILEKFSVQDVNTLSRLYLEFGFELEEIFAYARRYKKATNEMSSSDFEEIEKTVEIMSVMES